METLVSKALLDLLPRPSNSTDRPMPRILVVDDQSHVRAAIMLGLQTKNLEVVGVDSGAAGLKAFEASHFDLAIVDVFMLGMDGITLIKALHERRRNLPVIAISGVRLDASGSTALDQLAAVTGQSNIICLQKPFRADQLFQAIETIIGTAI